MTVDYFLSLRKFVLKFTGTCPRVEKLPKGAFWRKRTLDWGSLGWEVWDGAWDGSVCSLPGRCFQNVMITITVFWEGQVYLWWSGVGGRIR